MQKKVEHNRNQYVGYQMHKENSSPILFVI